MLEVVIPGTRHGQAKIIADSAYNGYHCWISGVDADGYQRLSLPYSSVQAARALYPINKYYFSEDLSDTSAGVDKLTNGDLVIYYEGGEYITDMFDHSSLGLTTAYWQGQKVTNSTSWGRAIYSQPGSSTAIATTGLDKLWVAVTNTAGGAGRLTANSALAHLFADAQGFIGYAVGVYFTDSSDAKLRYRIAPSNNGRYSHY